VTVLGYPRVSTVHQSVEMQVQALKDAGAERIWTEHMSDRRDDRPELAALLSYARAGDVLMVWRLDRLADPCPTCVCLSSRTSTPTASNFDR